MSKSKAVTDYTVLSISIPICWFHLNRTHPGCYWFVTNKGNKSVITVRNDKAEKDGKKQTVAKFYVTRLWLDYHRI